MSSSILGGATRSVDSSRAAATRHDVVCIIFVVARRQRPRWWRRSVTSRTSHTLPAKQIRGFTGVLFGQAARQFGDSWRHCLRDCSLRHQHRPGVETNQNTYGCNGTSVYSVIRVFWKETAFLLLKVTNIIKPPDDSSTGPISAPWKVYGVFVLGWTNKIYLITSPTLP